MTCKVLVSSAKTVILKNVGKFSNADVEALLDHMGTLWHRNHDQRARFFVLMKFGETELSELTQILWIQELKERSEEIRQVGSDYFCERWC